MTVGSSSESILVPVSLLFGVQKPSNSGISEGVETLATPQATHLRQVLVAREGRGV